MLSDDALETLNTAIGLGEESTELSEIYEEHKQEWEDDHKLDPSHESMIRFTQMEDWLWGGGSKFDKLKIRYYSDVYWGVHAARDIKAGE